MMRDEDPDFSIDNLGGDGTFDNLILDHDRGIHTALQMWNDDRATAAALQGFMMRDEDPDFSIDNLGGDGTFDNLILDHDRGIRTALQMWNDDRDAAKARYGPIASWDTSEITIMYELFQAREGFNEDISRWNVSNVGRMDSMFRGATSFNGDLSSWNVGQVKDMTRMFMLATSFNSDLSSWNVGQVEDMNHMFEGATSFNSDLSSWNVGQVKDMRSMFMKATSFNSDLSSWNVGQVKDMTRMFDLATSFNRYLSSWNVGQVEDMYLMFSGATSFNRQLGGAWTTSLCNKHYMFWNSPGTIAGRTKTTDGTILNDQ